MLQRTYPDQVCSLARALEILGERWTLLIVRDALLGRTRFDELLRSLGVARNILTDRLKRLVDAGVLERVEYQQRPPRSEYRLTPQGRELGVALVALMHWGDRHLADAAGPPRLTRHRDCGGLLDVRLHCRDCDTAVDGAGLEVVPGPGLTAPGTRPTAKPARRSRRQRA